MSFHSHMGRIASRIQKAVDIPQAIPKATVERVKSQVANRVSGMTEASKPPTLQEHDASQGGRPANPVKHEALTQAQSKPLRQSEIKAMKGQETSHALAQSQPPKGIEGKPSTYWSRAEHGELQNEARQNSIKASEQHERRMLAAARAGDVDRAVDMRRAMAPGGAEKVAESWQQRLGRSVSPTEVQGAIKDKRFTGAGSVTARGEAGMSEGERASHQSDQASHVAAAQKERKENATPRAPTQSPSALAPHPAMVAARKQALSPAPTNLHKPAVATYKDDNEETPEKREEEAEETVPELLKKAHSACATLRKSFSNPTKSVAPPTGGGVHSPGGNPHG